MAEITAPITARGIGNWLKWLAEQMNAGAISLAGRVHQGASAAIQGATIAGQVPGALLYSFFTGQPGRLSEFRPYDPWQDPVFVEAQRTMGRLPPVQRVENPPPATSGETLAAMPVPDQILTGQAATLQELRERGLQPTYTMQQQQGSQRRGSASSASAVRSAPSPLPSERIPVTPVPDQILAGVAPTIADLQKMGLEPTYFLAPAEVIANADRPLLGQSMPNVGQATAALAAGERIPDQVLLGYYPSIEAMRAAGVQPTYVLQGLYRSGNTGTSAVQSTGTVSKQTPDWLSVYQRQQDLLDVLGVVTERGQALRMAARRAAETPGASVAELYWEQGFEPMLRRYGFSEEALRQKKQELQELERDWRRYGQIQDFAEFLWINGYDPFTR
uniref:Uncharacterized protein n=1 Tax=Thermomicrobium roseum TaxID=500 RepID=A0A7C5VXU9_THERO